MQQVNSSERGGIGGDGGRRGEMRRDDGGRMGGREGGQVMEGAEET